MAKAKSGDGFNVDFSDMFIIEENTQPKEVKQNIANTTNITNTINEAVENNIHQKSEPKTPVKDKALPYTIYLLDEDDREFLQFRAQSKRMTMTDFLWNLIEKDIKNFDKKNIDTTDLNHKKFRNVNLSATTSIKATKKQRESLMEPAARHRLKITRYIAYVVHDAKENDATW